LFKKISISTFFGLILDLLSDIICPVVLNVLSDSVEDAGMHKYFLDKSGKGFNSSLTYKYKNDYY